MFFFAVLLQRLQEILKSPQMPVNFLVADPTLVAVDSLQLPESRTSMCETEWMYNRNLSKDASPSKKASMASGS